MDLTLSLPVSSYSNGRPHLFVLAIYMSLATPEAEKLVVGRDESYGSTGDQGSGLGAYAEYHKICDMRKVFDLTPLSLVGVGLTFLLVFTGWCAWHESVEWVAKVYNLDGDGLVRFAAIVNAAAVLVIGSFLVLMRYLVGPVLSYHWRSVFAVLLVAAAIAIWEALEAGTDLLVGNEPDDKATFYLIACGVTCALTFMFERIFHYDVIGNHLLTPP